jgi:hypothetical protein
MGVYDRDYMRDEKPRRMEAGESPYRRPVKGRAPWWARLKFRLWLLLKGR